jgi:hypothetical protein
MVIEMPMPASASAQSPGLKRLRREMNSTYETNMQAPKPYMALIAAAYLSPINGLQSLLNASSHVTMGCSKDAASSGEAYGFC